MILEKYILFCLELAYTDPLLIYIEDTNKTTKNK